MNELRKLRFEDLGEAVWEARSLLESGYTRQGQWSLGQICQHLVLVQDPSIDGYPSWMSLFAPLRPLMRRWLLPKLLADNSPPGIRTSSTFMPAQNAEDALEVTRFEQSVKRLKARSEPFFAQPAFGKLSNTRILQIHSAHAAHHLRFLEP
ncbi:MAG: DUF1569 domain-containing protein [Planctomycetota bacterium]